MLARFSAAFLAALLAALLAPLGAGAQSYPSRPVTIVVPFPPGGSTDWLSRLIGHHLGERLKGTFIVENRAGGSTLIAASAVAKAEPDGHTLLMTTSTTMAINVSVFKNLPYDPRKDFTPVALVAGVPFVLLVNPTLPVHSIPELVSFAKSKRSGLDYVSTGPGSAANLYMVMLKNALGIDMTPIPYKGNAPGLSDVVAGHVSVMFSDLLSAVELARSGKVRALGLSTAQRSPVASDILPLSQAGVPGYDASAWQMLVAPAGTPQDVVAKLNGEIHAIVSDPAVKREIDGRGHIAIATPPPDELKAYVESEIARWRKVVEAAGAAGSE
jgi:tripartite-type tricarboxylate transporter receptor subunit TctC